jgi:ferredoxin
MADGLRKRCVADYLCGKESTDVADSSTTNPASRTSPLGGFTVELARSGREFFIPEGSRILEVLLDEGIDVDFSCELGICGACEQRVISGIPEHHDSILSEEEQAENKRVMICCAGCKTDRLVLDL